MLPVAALILVVQTPTLTPYAQIAVPALSEASGMVLSRRQLNVIWAHNDSGDSARIFAINRNGQAVRPRGATGAYAGIPVADAKNVDWEDIALIGSTLYISDMGNNQNARKDLGVYAVAEPDPRRDTVTRAAKWLPVKYPDQTEFPPSGDLNFDCEAAFGLRNKLYFITKSRVMGFFPGRYGALYRLDSQKTDSVNVLTKIESKDDFDGWVTAADTSPDGKMIAVLTHLPGSAVYLFDATAAGDRFLSHPIGHFAFQGGKQCESIAFDGDSLIIGNEQRDLFRVPLAWIKDKP